jgi:predicted ATP-grasp superfamily ATP-dependent carboligase
MIPVKGHPNLYRDEISGAIVNCDNQAYNQYINSINNRRNQQLQIENLQKDVDEIKQLLKELLNGSKSN